MRIGNSDGVPAEHIVVANSGWYLFNSWPLACGNVTPKAFLPWRFFHNDVHERIIHGQMVGYAAERQCDIEEMNIFNDEQVLLSIPGTSFPLPIPYVLTYRELQISGVLVKRDRQTAQPPTPEQRRRQTSREMRRLLDEIPEGGAK